MRTCYELFDRYVSTNAQIRANIIVNVITIYISTLRDQISMNFRFHETCEVLKFSRN
jgi:hypothetical protein